ncbi:uncharacterized protein EV420DRAFT_1636651 [Desarmillaria tabescens]|uniref:Uncharacterized protein n=1 Tax=Armillaria tabescens TaxID=1929756 RepID=A0AA39NI46_ARMTA|nr:uncharacterized protein EV420DRAFT_1636651 [Desarmillaria tabescens]KAK0466055.1 hypothetical protein EV420DRAFT_1636651 [Desarmillaria tabescens]
MTSKVPSSTEQLRSLLRIIPHYALEEYRHFIREHALEPALVALLPDIYSINNAINWASLQDLATWYGHFAQRQAVQKLSQAEAEVTLSLPASISQSIRINASSQPNQVSSGHIQAQTSTSVTPSKACSQRPHKKARNNDKPINDSVSKSDTASQGQKISITREKSSAVDKIIDIDSVPPTFDVPSHGTCAYHINLQNFEGQWPLDVNGKPKSMAAFIKGEDQDSWGRGSAGSLKDGPKVVSLGGRISRDLIEGIEHYDAQSSQEFAQQWFDAE